MKQDLGRGARSQLADKAAAELEAAKFYDLIKGGRRVDVIKGWEAMRSKPLTKSEAQFFAEAVEHAKVEQATALYLQGLDSVRLQRWQEAAGAALEESIRYDDAAPISPQAKLELASADRKLHKQKEAIAILAPLVEQPVDRDILDDALEQLAWSQTEIEAYNDAKNTWRTLLRKFPDSHFAAEGKLALQVLMQNH